MIRAFDIFGILSNARAAKAHADSAASAYHLARQNNQDGGVDAQALAYDPSEYPHFIDLPSAGDHASRHGG